MNKPQTNPHTRVFVFLCERHIWYSSPVTKSIKCTCAPPKNLRLQVQQREFKCLIFSPHRRTPSGSHANRFSLQTYLMLHLHKKTNAHTYTHVSSTPSMLNLVVSEAQKACSFFYPFSVLLYFLHQIVTPLSSNWLPQMQRESVKDTSATSKTPDASQQEDRCFWGAELWGAVNILQGSWKVPGWQADLCQNMCMC